MTDYQFRTIIKMILELVKGSKDREEIIRKLENMLKKEQEED